MTVHGAVQYVQADAGEALTIGDLREFLRRWEEKNATTFPDERNLSEAVVPAFLLSDPNGKGPALRIEAGEPR